MSDLNRKMKNAADKPDRDVDVALLWRRGRVLRFRRLVVAFSFLVLAMGGAGWAALSAGDGGDQRDGAKDEIAADPESSPEECRDREPNEDGNVRYCIARGTYEGSEWTWFAYFNKEGELCESFSAPDGGGGSCGPYREPVDEISLGLSGGGVLDPLLDAELPNETASAFVETDDGKRLEMEVFDAPPELGIAQKFGLYFHLPKNATRVIALDAEGSQIASAGLDQLVDGDAWALLNDLQRGRDGGGSVVGSGVVGGEPWILAANYQSGLTMHCVLLALGNDPEAADAEIGADWCSDSGVTDDLLFEQMWWSGLKNVAPAFGSVPRQASSLTLELDNGVTEKVDILKSPEEGTWPRPVYETDFAVAFPPVGASGQLVARTAEGEVLSTWPLCLVEAETKDKQYAACDENTEFWQPPE